MIGVIAALVIGAGVLMATIAFSAQRYFEYQVELRAKAAQPADAAAQRNSAKPTQ